MTYNVKVITRLTLCSGDPKVPAESHRVPVDADGPLEAARLAYEAEHRKTPYARIRTEVTTGATRHTWGDGR